MLYTLIGNGTFNPIEIQASLESLRSAVEEPDEFWMMLADAPELSDTVKAIVTWLDAEGIIYEVVVTEGTDINPDLKNADFVHPARRALDYLLRLTKYRVAEDETSAVLILSDDLDNDNVALYAIERAVAEDIPVFDLGGQLTSIVLEEEPDVAVPPTPDVVETNGAAVVEEPLVDTQMHQEAVESNATRQVTDEEAMAAGQTKEELAQTPKAAPLSYTRAELDELTRDELKNLVKTQGVTPTDMRSKTSMAEALMDALEPTKVEPGESVDTGGGRITVTEPDIEGKDLAPQDESIQRGIEQAEAGNVVDLGSFLPEATDATLSYLVQTDEDGRVIQLRYIPQEKVALIDTLLGEDE